MSAWSIVAAAAALICFGTLFLAGLILLAVFVRQAALALLTIGELRERTDETAERRATVVAARHAVEDVRGAYGGSGEPDYMAAILAERQANGKPFRTAENEQRHPFEEEQEPAVQGDSFYVPAEEQ